MGAGGIDQRCRGGPRSRGGGIASDVNLGLVNRAQIVGGEDRLRSTVTGHRAVLDQQYAVGVQRRCVQIVQGRHHRHPGLDSQLAKAREDFGDMFEVEKCGGLVEQGDVRRLRQGSRQEDAFAFATRQFLDRTAGQFEQIETLERRVGDFEVVAGFEMKRTQMRRTAHQHDFEHGEAKGNQVLLCHNREPPGDRAPVVRTDWLALEFYDPAPRGECAAENSEQGGFARAVGPDNRKHLAGQDFKRNPVQDLTIAVTRIEIGGAQCDAARVAANFR